MEKIILVVILATCCCGSLMAQQPTISQLEQRADSLYEQFDEQNALEAYLKILEKRPDNHEALWKTSFLYSRVGYRLEDEDKREEYYNRAIELAERAIEVDSTHTQSHFVKAVALGRKALISGARERVEVAKAIKEHVDQAIKADSTNAGAWHVLGRWHFELANLNFFERLAANALYGGVPGNASNEKAEEAIEKAIELNPKYPLYYYDLATVYDKTGREEQATSICKEALSLEPVGPDDEQFKDRCRELIRELQ
jgi:tetratricopeptide (TPR) repeat protein